MTNKQRVAAVRRARRNLHLADGYNPKGSHYKAVDDILDALEADFRPKVPALGPVFRGGKSILLHDLTHPTGGIPLYPAFDDAFNSSGGIEVVAPEDLVVTRASSSRPGDAFYAKGKSGIRYWFGHLEIAPAVGRKFRQGQVMGKTLDHNVGGGPHVHVGLNIEDVVGKGKELEHSRYYKHGAPKVGVQLAALLDT